MLMYLNGAYLDSAAARGSEVFLTGTTTDVMPVVRLDGRPVGTGRPGPVARQLHARLRERMGRRAAAPAT